MLNNPCLELHLAIKTGGAVMSRLSVGMRKVGVSVFVIFSCFVGAANAELVLSAPPRETAEK